jgi:hypothetical protein
MAEKYINLVAISKVMLSFGMTNGKRQSFDKNQTL